MGWSGGLDGGVGAEALLMVVELSGVGAISGVGARSGGSGGSVRPGSNVHAACSVGSGIEGGGEGGVERGEIGGEAGVESFWEQQPATARSERRRRGGFRIERGWWWSCDCEGPVTWCRFGGFSRAISSGCSSGSGSNGWYGEIVFWGAGWRIVWGEGEGVGVLGMTCACVNRVGKVEAL